MNAPSETKTVDIATFRKWGFRFAIATTIFVSLFLFALFYSLFTSISSLRNGSIPILDIVGYLFGLLIFITIPIALYFAILKTWPQFQIRLQHPKEP